jgi:hypothetical protein
MRNALADNALALTTEETKKKLFSISYNEIIEGIQSTINTNIQCSKQMREGTGRLVAKQKKQKCYTTSIGKYS